ncbi:hypothetical protein HHI36_023342 [Cryptolaemus montrouzieri]|uniref:Uncharacterized protein n=1 Tax=Cryptolaemus montrouzieri TaxID=559131 RepID=A0ABD2PGQ9_9CUCU
MPTKAIKSLNDKNISLISVEDKDNGANTMAGTYGGVQRIMKDVQPNVEKIIRYINDSEKTSDVNQMSQNITTTLMKASEEVARKKGKRKNKISDETMQKIQKRKQLYRLGQYATDRYRQM